MPKCIFIPNVSRFLSIWGTHMHTHTVLYMVNKIPLKDLVAVAHRQYLYAHD